MKINLTIASRIELPLNDLPEQVLQSLKENLVFNNPKWEENRNRGRWNGDTPRRLYFIHRDESGNNLLISRGFITRLVKILNSQGVEYNIIDKTRIFSEIDFDFTGKLYPFQEKAVEAVVAKRFGLLNAPTGSGKTVMAMRVIAERKQPALVVLHSKELMYQWREQAERFLNIPSEQIGLIGDGHTWFGEKLTIAIINSLYKCIDEARQKVGLLIVDECHRIPSKTFLSGVSQFDCSFMLGLSATPYRRDKLTKVIHLQLGDQLYNIDIKELQQKKRVMKATLKVRNTDFDYDYQDDYGDMLAMIVQSTSRNRMIAEDVVSYVESDKGMALVISDRKEHCTTIYEMLLKKNIESRLLTGSVASSMRKVIIDDLYSGEVNVLVATSQLIGEGFDLKELSAIFLTTPVKFTGRLKQYIGRILRVANNKHTPVIYDYLDNPGVLQASFRSRQVVYQEIGAGNSED